MKASTWIWALAFSTSVAAHGYVRSINIDGTIYPGFNPHQDSRLGVKRIAFGFHTGWDNVDGIAAVLSADSLGIACNADPTIPGEMAEARAGSNITFRWTDWLPSHRGPITTYMAPYEGNISDVNVNKLKFFKIDEAGIFPNEQFGKLTPEIPWSVKPNWATDKMVAANSTWTSTIPWDIKPGNYIVRHEVLSLHFASPHSNYKYYGIVAPQFYPSCYNIRVTGNGTTTPAGVSFPGAYVSKDPAFVFDIYLNKTDYPIAGPTIYRPRGPAPLLEKNSLRIISPMGDPVKDAAYKKAMESDQAFFDQVGGMIYKLGG